MITDNAQCPHCQSHEEEVGFYHDNGEPCGFLLCNGCNQTFRDPGRNQDGYALVTMTIDRMEIAELLDEVFDPVPGHIHYEDFLQIRPDHFELLRNLVESAWMADQTESGEEDDYHDGV